MAVLMAMPPADVADVTGFFVLLVAAVMVLCGLGYLWSYVREDERQDEDAEIVERKRLNLIVRWPR